ncbi:hypothetical protein BDR26DRAFT_997055 [Obelidium mucronatum]|nr:hypothetical protein BDR26DRAFT_997055 [Obelidium mucronatum]
MADADMTRDSDQVAVINAFEARATAVKRKFDEVNGQDDMPMATFLELSQANFGLMFKLQLQQLDWMRQLSSDVIDLRAAVEKTLPPPPDKMSFASLGSKFETHMLVTSVREDLHMSPERIAAVTLAYFDNLPAGEAPVGIDFTVPNIRETYKYYYLKQVLEASRSARTQLVQAVHTKTCKKYGIHKAHLVKQVGKTQHHVTVFCERQSVITAKFELLDNITESSEAFFSLVDNCKHQNAVALTSDEIAFVYACLVRFFNCETMEDHNVVKSLKQAFTSLNLQRPTQATTQSFSGRVRSDPRNFAVEE